MTALGIGSGGASSWLLAVQAVCGCQCRPKRRHSHCISYHSNLVVARSSAPCGLALLAFLSGFEPLL